MFSLNSVKLENLICTKLVIKRQFGFGNVLIQWSRFDWQYHQEHPGKLLIIIFSRILTTDEKKRKTDRDC